MSDASDAIVRDRIKDLLGEFAARAQAGPFRARYCHHSKGPDGAPHVVFGIITHGNECGSLPAAVRLQHDLITGKLSVPLAVTILLGNPEAALENRRFLEEDLNRVITFDRPSESWERRRAEELRPILDSADVFLDIHQTQTPTASAFWTMPWEAELGLWARALGAAPKGLTRPAGGVFSQGKCCLDEYVRARGKVGITVEIGEKGFSPEQDVRAERALRRTLGVVERWSAKEPLYKIAEEQPAIDWYETREVVPAQSAEHRLRPGLSNFTAVTAGELLSAPDAPEIRASADGFILFPKYPAPTDLPPPELYRLGVPIENRD